MRSCFGLRCRYGSGPESGSTCRWRSATHVNLTPAHDEPVLKIHFERATLTLAMPEQSELRITLCLFLVATLSCAAEEPTDPTPLDSGGASIEDCSYPLVTLGTGRDETCEDSANEQLWPVGLAADACLGWLVSTPSGDTGERSASNIQCQADGSFSFTVHPDTLLCDSDKSETMSYSEGVCEQESAILFGVAIDLDCCRDPVGPRCAVGVPSIATKSDTYLNGKMCAEPATP
jgi:hypothetical protein